ncbi:MAG: hypothetical protein ABSH50_07425 [Bryobacteraceae bacterium]
MTRDRKAQIATVLILAGALTLVAAKRSGWRPAAIIQRTAPVTPQDTVYRMMDAARDGDVRAYLGCYTGPMESSLRQIVKEKGESSLADYIRSFNASVKGIAIQEPQNVAENEVRLRVEFVYRDRNEAQIYYLQQSAAGWRIARQENTEGVKAVVPYGTPVE